MKKINILYWIFTGLYSAVIVLTSLMALKGGPESTQVVVDLLHYPAYFVPFISVAKILGGIMILIPGFPRLKEWAYAGLAFDLISAIYSFIAIGTPIAQQLPMLLFVIVLALSYIFYHKKLSMTSANSK